jgi:hypothetical protein
MLPIMLPTTDETGELVAVGFQDSEVWIYGIPGRIEITQTNPNPGSQAITGTRLGGNHHYDGQSAPRDNLAQLDKIVQQPKVLVRGRRVTDMHGISSIRWVRPLQTPSPRRRLVAVAPGGVRPQVFGEEDVPIDGGRLLLLDFERSITHGEETELDIEIGDTAPKILTEPDSSLDTEVELERRRTRLRRPDTDSALAHRPSMPPLRGTQRSTSQTQIPLRRHNSLAAPTPPGESASGGVVDIPYDNTQPRSQETLHRAATAAASTRGRYDPRYRNTPSRRQIPHESDADNWVPPPPPYSKEPDRPLPEHLQQTLLPGVPPAPQNHNAAASTSVQRAQTTVVRPNPQDRPRPQSAILQRLGTIAGGRLPGRSRSGSTTSPGEPNQDQVNIIGSHAPPAPHVAQQDLATNETVPVHQWPQRPHTAATPIVPVATGHIPSVQPLPTLAVHPAEERTQHPMMAMPSLGATMLGEAYLPYSVSSPNLLHIPQPYGNALDIADNDETDIPARQRSFRRRVSTEPTSLPPSENEEWRRRIEDWNEHTVRERSRRRRSKCIVM